MKKPRRKRGFPETAVAEYDEKGEDFGIAVLGNPFADTAALGEAFYSEEARVFEAERRAILKLAEKGDCVIIGRCASAILRGAGEHPLSVFISMPILPTAPDALPPGTGWTNGAPCTGAQKIDRMRKHHFDFYADTLWGEPASYDLMLSSSEYGITGAAEVIAAAARAGK